METKKNVGSADRYVRVILGMGFILNIFSLEPTRFGMFILLLFGLMLLNTALNQYCPVYDLLKINTFEKKPKEKPEQTQNAH